MKKKEPKAAKSEKQERKDASPKTFPDIPFREKYILAAIFALAFGVRLVCLIQFSQAPNFESPIGDSNIYYSRSQDIMAGNIIGDEIYFHSSPPYPYFMAAIFAVSGGSFFALRLIQILIGSGNCVLIYLLAKKLSTHNKIAPTIAGTCAALYGVLAFFDLDLLMIFMTLFLADACLLMLIRAREGGSLRWTFGAGIVLGLAALDKTNLLLFAPFAAWYLAGGFSWEWKEWKWARGFVLAAGVISMIVPVTIRNHAVGKDLVLVSSNAGVNLFIGNNPEGPGIFFVPPSSGLTNIDLPGTAKEVAQKQLGRSLKPSEVSRFWSGRAKDFIFDNPLDAARLIGTKCALLLNSFEIPNHLNFYFIRQDYVRAYNYLPVGFWLIAPLGLVGMFRRWRNGMSPAEKLLAGFLVTYTLSVLPFFITARYRLPLVPVMIVFAAVGTVEWIRNLGKSGRRELAILGAILIAAFIFVNRPRAGFSYSFNRVGMATKYMERAVENKDTEGGGRQDIKKAIVELKRALETAPFSADAHYNLGRAYEMVGFYSGAIKEWQETLKIDPGMEFAARGIEKGKSKLEKDGDLVPPDAIPKTPYELARAERSRGNGRRELEMYERIIDDDPFHFMALNNMAFHYYQEGDLEKSVKLFEKGLEIQPDHFFMLNNLAGAYYKLGEKKKAKELWQRCLEIQPESELILNQLKMAE